VRCPGRSRSSSAWRPRGSTGGPTGYVERILAAATDEMARVISEATEERDRHAFVFFGQNHRPLQTVNPCRGTLLVRSAL
jgi:hypothetical protein